MDSSAAAIQGAAGLRCSPWATRTSTTASLLLAPEGGSAHAIERSEARERPAGQGESYGGVEPPTY
jgi:hypothetical protein